MSVQNSFRLGSLDYTILSHTSAFFPFRCYTVHEAVELIAIFDQENSSTTDLILCPPVVRDETDEESGKSDEENLDPNNLTRYQVLAPAIVEQQQIDNCSDEEGEDFLSIETSSAQESNISLLRDFSWKDTTDIQQSSRPLFPESNNTHYNNLTPSEILMLFIDDKIVEHIMYSSNIYAAQKGNVTHQMSKDEFYAMLGIFILSGYNQGPNRRMFWEFQEDCHNQLISQSMRRNRFEEITRHLHFQDNTKLDQNDKLTKLRPLIAHFNKKFADLAPTEKNTCGDESMIEYYGHCSLKQFIKGKPIRYGYKAWCLNYRLGYCLQFEIYQGA